ncbi:Uma2 family endonuclease [Streptomyces atratus]|uniref:Uma2 family endonuclease n=1 Tax=Streptomyces atratus TaxID=1893 RepID=UPI003399EE06
MPTSTDKGVSRAFTRPSGFTKLMRPSITAGLDDGETEVLQGVGLWLPGGPEDYAIPDLSVVDADLDEHVIENNCYALLFSALCRRSPPTTTTMTCAPRSPYAEAKIPVYVIVNRKHGRVHVLTEPVADGYDSHQVYAPGRQVTLPASIGAEVTLDVADLLKAGQHRK